MSTPFGIFPRASGICPVFQEVDDLGDFLLGLIHARDIAKVTLT